MNFKNRKWSLLLDRMSDIVDTPEPDRMQHEVEVEVHRDVAGMPGSGRRGGDCPGSTQSPSQSRLLCSWTSLSPARRRDRAAEHTPLPREVSPDGRSGECLACSTTAGPSLGHPGGDNKPSEYCQRRFFVGFHLPLSGPILPARGRARLPVSGKPLHVTAVQELGIEWCPAKFCNPDLNVLQRFFSLLPGRLLFGPHSRFLIL